MNMKDGKIAVILAVVVFLLIIGLSYFIEGQANWIVAIGTTIGFSIAFFILNNR